MMKGDTEKNGIVEGVIWKQLLAFFVPILLGTLFQQLYNTVDAIIVGKAVGKEALAAVGGATSTLINLLVGFFVGLSTGAAVIISQYYGAKRHKDVSKAVHTTIAMAIGGGVCLTTLGIVVSEPVLRLMGTPEDVMVYAVPYIRIFFIGLTAQLIYNIGSGILRAVGDSRRPMFFLMVAAITNIILDVFFVLGLEMGVQGAAMATVVSQIVSAGLVLVTLIRASGSYRLYPRKVCLNPSMFMQTVQIGLPAGLQSVMYSLSNLIIQAGVNGFGTDTMAAWTAYGKVDAIYWAALGAFGAAITTFSGQNFGARQYERMKQSVSVCLRMASVMTILMSAALLVFGRILLGLFCADEQVVEIGMLMMRTIVPFYIVYVAIEILSGALRGVGDTLIPTVMTLCGVCLLRVFWVGIVTKMYHTLTVLVASYPITWIITAILFIVYYRRGRWFQKATANQSDRML